MAWKSAPPDSTRPVQPSPCTSPPTMGMTRRLPAGVVPISWGVPTRTDRSANQRRWGGARGVMRAGPWRNEAARYPNPRGSARRRAEQCVELGAGGRVGEAVEAPFGHDALHRPLEAAP